MKEKLILVKLNNEQIKNAIFANGRRKKITHAVICGEYGQLFGSEIFCRKYFNTWGKIFHLIFPSSSEEPEYQIRDFTTTFNLVNKLILVNDQCKSKNEHSNRE
ncbi:hypothetical protein [Raoultella ornithinolytica]|uniref:hypothetical protein n=1 Tax=Raoultella ornithinolytica TaxID=54291 RepID=UPI000E57E955|nr:hypothetical protein [Raoultella ornithinolytica]